MNVSNTPDPWAAPEPLPPPRSATLRVPLASPAITYTLLGLTVLAFLMQYVGNMLLGFDIISSLGAKVNALIVRGQLWRLVTPVFVHAGLAHIGFNMYALYTLGPQVEGPFGHARFLFLYFYSGITGVLLSLVMSPEPSVGASGAIFGLIGALAVYLFRHRREFGELGRQRLSSIAMVMLVNLFLGLSPGIDNWGHLGGLIGGIGVALLLGPRLQVVADPGTGSLSVVDGTSGTRRWFSAGALGALLVGMSTAAIWLSARGV